MKKTLGLMLALAMIVPGPASAELFNNLKVTGQLDIQSTSARNVLDFQTHPDSCLPIALGGCDTGAAVLGTENDRISDTLTRTMVGMSWDLLDDVHAQIGLLKNDRTWGGPGANAGGQLATGAAGGQTLTNGAAGNSIGGNVWVHLANVKIDKFMGHFNLTLGRQYYGEPGDLIIYFGPYDTHGLFVSNVDAIRVDSENDMMTMTAAMGVTAAAALSLAGPNAKTYVKGLDIGWKGLPMKANTFVWNRTIQAAGAFGTSPNPNPPAVAGGKNDQLWVYGLKLRGEAAGGWLSLDAAANSGTDRTSGVATGCIVNVVCPAGTARYTGYGFLADTGYNAEVANIGGFTPWGTFGFGSGRSSTHENKNENFTAINSDFRPGVVNRRFSGTNAAAALGSAYYNQSLGGAGIGTQGLGNRVVWGLGFNFTPAVEDRATVGLSFWDFRFQRITDSGAWGVPGTVSPAPSAHGGNRHIGSEAGVTGEWRHSENVTLGAGWATFQPGGFIKNEMQNAAGRRTIPATDQNAGNNPVQLVYADFTIKF